MKILVTGAPLAGHLNPLLAVGRLLAQEGHEVVGQTASVFRRSVEASGLTFHPFHPAADIDMRDMDAFFPERKNLPPGPASRKLSWERLFIERMPHHEAGLRALLREFPAEVVIAGNAFFGTLPILLGPRDERPAIVHCGASFLPFSRDDRAPGLAGLPPAATEDERRSYAEIAAEWDAGFVGPLQRQLDGMLAQLGSPSLPMNFLDASVTLPDLYLQPSVPGFEFPRASMPPNVHFVGALPLMANPYALPAWAGDLDGSRKVVLVTQGTVANHDLGALIVPTLTALADEPDLLVVATTGGRSTEELRVPANARVAEFLPFDWLMPKIDLVITNGGYGSVTHALSLGVPLLVAGTTEDKREVSARVTWSGVGLSLGTDRPDPAQIRSGARRVMGTPAFATRAAALAREFHSYDARNLINGLVSTVCQGRSTAA